METNLRNTYRNEVLGDLVNQSQTVAAYRTAAARIREGIIAEAAQWTAHDLSAVIADQTLILTWIGLSFRVIFQIRLPARENLRTQRAVAQLLVYPYDIEEAKAKGPILTKDFASNGIICDCAPTEYGLLFVSQFLAAVRDQEQTYAF